MFFIFQMAYFMGTILRQEIINMVKSNDAIYFYVIKHYLSPSGGMGDLACRIQYYKLS